MRWSSVTVQTGPTAYPVTLQEAKAACRVLHADQDAEILGYIAAATAEVDGPKGIGIALLQQTWRFEMDCFRGDIIKLPGWPITSVDSVNYRDEAGANQTVSTADYTVSLVEPVRIESEDWPNVEDKIGAVWVDYTLGSAVVSGVPEDIRLAIIARVQQLYDADAYGLLDNFINATHARYRRGLIAA